MDTARKSGLAGGLVLILLGLAFLAAQLLPGLWSWVSEVSWPLIVVGAGALLLIIGWLVGAPNMAVPACIVGGIGGLLYWQNATGDWASWAYAWALIPGFAGVGNLIAGLWAGKSGQARGGAWSVLISLILFAIFGSFMGGFTVLGVYWPVLVIALGLLLLGEYFIRSRRQVHARRDSKAT